MNESRVPTVPELEELEEWANQSWQCGRAPQSLHIRKLVGKLLVGYAALLEMVSSPAYQRLTGSKSIPLPEQLAQRAPTRS